MKYLRGIIDYAILYSGFFVVLEEYNNANWISNSGEIKFISGYILILGGGAMTWKSSISIHCDCQTTISIARNKSVNGKNRHIQLRYDVVK